MNRNHSTSPSPEPGPPEPIDRGHAGANPPAIAGPANPFGDRLGADAAAFPTTYPTTHPADLVPPETYPPENSEYGRRLYQLQVEAAERRLRDEQRQAAIAHRNEVLQRVQRATLYLVGALETLLALRFVLQFFGANPSNTFAKLIAYLASPYIAPFSTLFTNPHWGAASVLDLNAIVAMLAYGIIGSLFVKLLQVVV